ncbi:hypothetical protein CR513_41168 [Mucuna pruriens]|uniref:Uncharacterized protein n=1 Tax=Mucuna pruriens TaxID=157652 RepID=A0A371FK89_MUCPR|nr:hypothetical protein CR513_41168 [Mucuna pruriens]
MVARAHLWSCKDSKRNSFHKKRRIVAKLEDTCNICKKSLARI